MEFYIGQTFDKPAPPQASDWCNKNNAKIVKDGKIRTIVAIPTPKTTKEELTEFLYQEKCKVAYGGVTVIKGGEKYLFETNQNSITMANGKAAALVDKTDDFIVNWKSWRDGFPVIMSITKAEFKAIFGFGMDMIDTAFGVEGTLNAQVQALTDNQLENISVIEDFKSNAIGMFSSIGTEFDLDVYTAVSSAILDS